LSPRGRRKTPLVGCIRRHYLWGTPGSPN
jgi:hypothetical protein